MTILYFHGFGAKLNGKKASCLKAHFGQDAVYEPPDPGFPYSKTLTSSVLQKLGEKLRNQPQSFLGLLGPNHLAELNRLSPELANFFPRSVNIAQELYDTVHPDIIVGSSLGAAVAMAMTSGDTPIVLIDPVWNRDIKPAISFGKIPVTGQMAEVLISIAAAALRNPIALLAGFDVPHSIKPQTVILHSMHDRIFDLANSRTLLRNSPIAVDDPRRKGMDRVVDRLAAAGYANQKSENETHFNDGRLIVIGKDHHNNETDPNDRHNKDPNPHNALITVVRLLIEEFGSN
jgi:hypothetical protein